MFSKLAEEYTLPVTNEIVQDDGFPEEFNDDFDEENVVDDDDTVDMYEPIGQDTEFDAMVGDDEVDAEDAETPFEPDNPNESAFMNEFGMIDYGY